MVSTLAAIKINWSRLGGNIGALDGYKCLLYIVQSLIGYKWTITILYTSVSFAFMLLFV